MTNYVFLSIFEIISNLKSQAEGLKFLQKLHKIQNFVHNFEHDRPLDLASSEGL